MSEISQLEGDCNDEFPNTLEYVGVREVSKKYDDEEYETALLKYTIKDSSSGIEMDYFVNAVSIGCPDCKENSTAIIKTNGEYECGCGYTKKLTRETLFRQGTEIDEEWEVY